MKWLFFDLGYTLVNEDSAHKKRIENCIETQRKLGRELSYSQIYDLMCKASREYRSQFYGAMEDLGITEKTPYPGEYETLYPQAKTVLKKLSEHYHIGIIANQSAGVNDRLCKFGINSLIEICVSSSDVGFSKPNPEIFRYALNKADCLPENAFMIGDRLDNDIFPANKVGMKTIWIKQGFGKYQNPINDAYKPDFEINSLEELTEILIRNEE